jgi:2-polyprenyl-3-methyl-5-hydroxy-6-metoxy-1,4-benzoquinol methylase
MKRAELNSTERYPRKWGTRSSHHLVLSLIGAGEGRRALDVGCAQGHLLGELVIQGWECIGIDSDSADVATCIERDLVAVELDITTDFPESLGLFDLVVFADVLEHLPDPTRVLRNVHSLLNPGARVVISVPNVAHLSVRAQLLFGRFPYSDRGILDRTHLRFFTRRTIKELLTGTDFSILTTTASAVPLELVWPALTRSRFGRLILALNDRLPALWGGGFAYQYILVASPNSDS